MDTRINTSKLTCRAYLTIARNVLKSNQEYGQPRLTAFDEVSKQLPNVSQDALRSCNPDSIVSHILKNRHVITHVIKY